MQYYFAYGSNLNVEQMKNRCPNCEVVCNANLKGYKLDFTGYSVSRGCCVATINPHSKSEVWGKVYKLTYKDLKNLDKYEGHPYFYQRIKIKVLNENKNEIEVISYKIIKNTGFVKPSLEYISIIIEAAKKHKFPKKYINYLIGVKNAL